MDARKFVAEAAGSFMLAASMLGAALFATGGASTALGVALSVGFAAIAMLYAVGTVSGGHFNPAVTIGLVAAGRFEAARVIPYVIAQCAGAILAAALFYFVLGTGKAPNLASVANGWDQLSPSRSGLFAVLLLETLLSAFLVVVYVGSTSQHAPAGFAPLAIGVALAAIHLIALPVSNASVNPARSLAAALFSGALALQQVWLFWLAPIVGAVVGGGVARWLLEE
jgi:aquaporin Z